jgi:hypothetical protein
MPGSVFWNNTLAKLAKRANSGDTLYSTGPSFLDYALKGNKGRYMVLPCENFQRYPFGEWDKSPPFNVFGRELLGRIYPTKYCGDYLDEDEYHFSKHHGAASWVKEKRAAGKKSS